MLKRRVKPSKPTSLTTARFLVNEIIKEARLPLQGRALEEVYSSQMSMFAEYARLAAAALRRHAAGAR